MGTRGMYGFVQNDVTKGTYNHSDSYPSELGMRIAVFAAQTSVVEMKAIFEQLVMVEDTAKPTKEQIKEVAEVLGAEGVTADTVDWYYILGSAQGDLAPYRSGLRYMSDGGDFIQDSLFCEWAYIINLDTEKLEIYKGFQETSQQNRYYDPSVEKEKYKNCRLVAEVPFEDLMAIDFAHYEDYLEQLNQ